MRIEVGKDLLTRIGQERARRGWSQAHFLGHLVNALRDEVPEDARQNIGVITNGSGEWSTTGVVELRGLEMETAFQQCAAALEIGQVDALERGLANMPWPVE